MAFFRKRVEFPDLWVGIVGDMLDGDTETWVVEILFPDLKGSLKRNRPKLAINEKQFDQHDFLKFKRAVVMTATESLASWVSPMQFFKFSEVARNTSLMEDFRTYLDLQDFINDLLRSLNTGDIKFLPSAVCEGSEIYGRKSILKGDQAQIFETANISLSFLTGYFRETAPPIYDAISKNPTSSRDTMVDFFAYVVRYWNHVLKDYKPI